RQARRHPDARRPFSHYRWPHSDPQPLHRTQCRPEDSGQTTQAQPAFPAATAHHRTGKARGRRSSIAVVETLGGVPLIYFTFFHELVKLGYHGQRAITSNAYVARRHLAMPASTDYWINDSSSDPLLVITGEVDAALTKAMPRLLREVREVVGERRVTIVF